MAPNNRTTRNGRKPSTPNSPKKDLHRKISDEAYEGWLLEVQRLSRPRSQGGLGAGDMSLTQVLEYYGLEFKEGRQPPQNARPNLQKIAAG